ncbi:hypothetical protein DFH08DRAFT_966371 [Mycena albidolilacea]|uniref:Uncharacterized protein n=1 Tax=Mycena albidolilacea TaxID=1033008 RepID=A0AAD6ZQ35_9AGAR|nr:hypothetical protein DFH08DRAFT_966371 [Mycena albidolilacea]
MHSNDITDKSKGNFLSKSVALLQGLWFSTHATLLGQEMQLFSFLTPLLGPSLATYDPLTSTTVPTLWSLPLPPKTQLAALGITTLVGTIFGGIHCAMWLTLYSTPAETWLWWAYTTIITFLPCQQQPLGRLNSE